MQLKIQITTLSVFDLLQLHNLNWIVLEHILITDGLIYFDFSITHSSRLIVLIYILTKPLCSLISASFWPNPYDFEPACLPEKKIKDTIVLVTVHTAEFLCLPKRLSDMHWKCFIIQLFVYLWDWLDVNKEMDKTAKSSLIHNMDLILPKYL